MLRAQWPNVNGEAMSCEAALRSLNPPLHRSERGTLWLKVGWERDSKITTAMSENRRG